EEARSWVGHRPSPTVSASPAAVADARRACHPASGATAESDCSNAGCVVVLTDPQEEDDSEGGGGALEKPNTCVAWIPPGGLARASALLSGPVSQWSLEGNKVCTTFGHSCGVHDPCEDTPPRCVLFGAPDQV